MKRRTLVVVLAVTAVLSAAVAVGAWAISVTGPGPLVGDCKTWQVADAGGRVSFPVPSFCRDDICEISAGWWGEPAGAYNPGLTFQVDFIQWNDGAWQAGPAICMAGECTSEGHGVNGDGVAESIFGPWGTPEGTHFQLWDDLAPEDKQLRMTLELHQADPAAPQFESVIMFICPG